jgi:hypothetical protein
MKIIIPILIISILWIILAIFNFFAGNDIAGWVSLAISQIWIVKVINKK